MQMSLVDTTNRLLDGCSLVDLCAHIHVCAAISSKTLQIGGELPVRRDAGSTGPMNPLYFTFHTITEMSKNDTVQDEAKYSRQRWRAGHGHRTTFYSG